MDAQAVDPRLIETSVRQVQGVYACRVVLESPSEIAEIHVVGSPSRRPKQIVRDIESLLFAKFGLRVNFRKISLAQLQEERGFTMLGNRPRLAESAFSSDGEQDRVSVRLVDGSSSVMGEASAPASSVDKGRLGSMAVLCALDRMSHGTGEFRVDAIERVPVGDRAVTVVLINVGFGSGEETLIGTAFYRGDSVEAAARATLDSVNRRLSLIRSL
jgi:hypothetical protein